MTRDEFEKLVRHHTIGWGPHSKVDDFLAHDQAQRERITQLEGALKDFVETFETDFVLDGVIVDKPDEGWGQLTRLYRTQQAALAGEPREERETNP